MWRNRRSSRTAGGAQQPLVVILVVITKHERRSASLLCSETFTSSFHFTYTVSRSRSPAESNRRIRTINSDSQATTPAPVVGPSFADIQREFQRAEPQQTVCYWVFGSVGSGRRGPLKRPLFGQMSVASGWMFLMILLC